MIYFGWGVGLSSRPSRAPFINIVIRKLVESLSWSAMGKTCSRCKVEKPLSEFGKHRALKDGLSGWCKTCCRVVGKKRQKTPAGVYQQIKNRNKFFNDHAFSLSKEAFVNWYENEPKICVYCELPEKAIPLVKEKYRGWSNRFTIDCKNNEVGYTLENIALACEICNRLKGSVLTFVEMCEVGQKYIKPKWEKLIGETPNE